jgi:hypothetical protein
LAAGVCGVALGAGVLPAWAAGSFACVPKGVNLASPMPFRLTAAQHEVLIRSYSAPEMQGLAAEFRATVAGTADRETRDVLAHVPPALLRNRFVLFADEPWPVGGDRLTIQFRHHPEAMYRTWVYRLSSGEWEVRSWERAPCSPAQQRFIRVTFGDALKGVP